MQQSRHRSRTPAGLLRRRQEEGHEEEAYVLSPGGVAALLRGLTVSREAAGAHAAFMASLQRRPAVRSKPSRLQVPQLQRFIPRGRAQEVPVVGEAAVGDNVAVVTESETEDDNR